MNDPFATPRTARDEMAERIQVLRKQAARNKAEAAQLRDKADELDAQAERQFSIASEYEAITGPAVLPTVATTSLGDKIRARRVALGMTQRSLAEAAGVDRGALSNVERGADSFSFRAESRLTETLDRLEQEAGR